MIYVNGMGWNVVKVPSHFDKLQRSDGIYTLGATDYNTKCVYINENLKGAFLDKVLCHELTHVISFSYNLYLDIETEEKIADFISCYGREVFQIADGFLYDYLYKKKLR